MNIISDRGMGGDKICKLFNNDSFSQKNACKLLSTNAWPIERRNLVRNYCDFFVLQPINGNDGKNQYYVNWENVISHRLQGVSYMSGLFKT